MGDEPSPELRGSLIRLGFAGPGGTLPPMSPLTGGVSSEIWRIERPEGAVVAKRALPQLRVAGVWRAPVERTAYEVAWMSRAEAIVPGLTPQVLAVDDVMFVMRHLPPEDHPLWKAQLLAGVAEPATASAVGSAVGAIHAATADDPAVAAAFDNGELFDALRLDPYLEAAAHVHPDRHAALRAVRNDITASRRVLVHGDISPKNILVGPHGPVVLDAECATWSDPAFDLGFCTTHLLLKCVVVPAASDGFLRCATALASSYLAAVTWEPQAELEARAARLVSALLLARVDGLSPVEYLTDDGRDVVRRTARALLAEPPTTLHELRTRWTQR